MSPKSANHHHKFVILFATSTLALSILIVLVANTFAKERLKWQQQVNRRKCDAEGEAIINVHQRVVKSVDSGQAGNYWAFDNYDRNIKVWKIDETTNEFCATVTYNGDFDAIAGQRSPGNTGILTGKEDGRFDGGYRMHIIGTMQIDPKFNITKGSIGTAYYNCDINGNCPGAFDWTTKYFNTTATGFSSTLEWWGWQYRAPKNKVWVNSIDGNSGDVI
ncbi:MAG: hypothetical protein HY044_04385 [Candidatus Woesebacteria bacterium]|nr:MAG: hypothetical protein HY044_04385 [Candidatus Woesebacteria bacterium]